MSGWVVRLEDMTIWARSADPAPNYLWCDSVCGPFDAEMVAVYPSRTAAEKALSAAYGPPSRRRKSQTYTPVPLVNGVPDRRYGR
jgi:hypothetical protein